MVSTSMLPGRGMVELSARPSKTRPGPPSRATQRMKVETASSSRAGDSIVVVRSDFRPRSGLKSAGYALSSFEEMQLRCFREDFAFMGIAVKQLQTFKASGVEFIMNVVSQIISDCGLANTYPGRPSFNDLFAIDGQQSVIARALKNRSQIKIAVEIGQRCTPHRPESEHERFTSKVKPLFREVVSAKAGAIYPQGGITDEQGSIIARQHLFQVRRFARERRFHFPELLKKNFDQSDRGQRRRVERDRGDFAQGDFADQKNGSHGPAGGDGDSREYGEPRNGCVGGGGNDSNVS